MGTAIPIYRARKDHALDDSCGPTSGSCNFKVPNLNFTKGEVFHESTGKSRREKGPDATTYFLN